MPVWKILATKNGVHYVLGAPVLCKDCVHISIIRRAILSKLYTLNSNKKTVVAETVTVGCYYDPCIAHVIFCYVTTPAHVASGDTVVQFVRMSVM